MNTIETVLMWVWIVSISANLIALGYDSAQTPQKDREVHLEAIFLLVVGAPFFALLLVGVLLGEKSKKNRG